MYMCVQLPFLLSLFLTFFLLFLTQNDCPLFPPSRRKMASSTESIRKIDPGGRAGAQFPLWVVRDRCQHYFFVHQGALPSESSTLGISGMSTAFMILYILFLDLCWILLGVAWLWLTLYLDMGLLFLSLGIQGSTIPLDTFGGVNLVYLLCGETDILSTFF